MAARKTGKIGPEATSKETSIAARPDLAPAYNEYSQKRRKVDSVVLGPVSRGLETDMLKMAAPMAVGKHFIAEQRTSPSPLVKLAVELHTMIFKNLGPAGQRILGSTCKTMYEVYRREFYQRKVFIHVNELHLEHISIGYTKFMTDWILHHWAPERTQFPWLDEEEDLQALSEHIKWNMLSRNMRNSQNAVVFCIGKIRLEREKEKNYYNWRPYFMLDEE